MTCNTVSVATLNIKPLVAFLAVTLITLTNFLDPSAARNTIDNPCSRDLSATGPETFLSFQQELRQTIAAFENLARHCQSSMEAYAENNLLTKDEINMLEGPLSNAVGLPARHQIVSDYPKLVQQLVRDYHDISIFLVYLRHTQNQQLAYDQGHERIELDNVENGLLSVLCRLDTMLRQRGTTLNKFVDVSIIPDQVKDIRNKKHRYFRDFLILKDSKIFLKAITPYYEIVLEQVLKDQELKEI